MGDARLLAANWIGDAALVVGSAIGFLMLRRRLGWRAVPIVALTLFGGFYGARVWGAIAYEHASVASDLWWRAATWNYFAHYHHASIMGGILGGIVGTGAAAFYSKAPIGLILGSLVPGVSAGQAVGRIQCHLVGCCFGKPTTLPWGVKYNADTIAGFWSGPIPLHPTQLYESILDAGLCIALLRLVAQSKERTAGPMFFFGYGLIWLFVECFRVGRDAHFLSLSSAQWLSLALIIIGISLWATGRTVSKSPYMESNRQVTLG